MPLLHFLLPIAPLITSTLAIPTTLSSRTSPYVTNPIPASGVNCFTANEPLHYFDASTISDYVGKGLNLYQQQHWGDVLTWKLEFSPDTQLSTTDHPVAWAEGCNTADQLYYYPLDYLGTCLPRLDTPDTRPPCGKSLTTDVVVFTMDDAKLKAQYCAVLTNSDSPTGTQAIAGDVEGGYRQCSNN